MYYGQLENRELNDRKNSDVVLFHVMYARQDGRLAF